jgi:hypothetical protein
MARRKKSESIFNAFDKPKSGRRKSGGISAIFGKSRGRKEKKSSLSSIFGKPKGRKEKKSSLSSIFGKPKGRKEKKSSLSSIFGKSNGSGRNKKEKSISSSFAYGKSERKPEYMRINGGSGWMAGLGGLLGLDIGSTRMDISDTSYETMQSFLRRHDFNAGNSNDVLYYLMHFDSQEEVRQMLTTAAGHSFNIAKDSEWIYTEWKRWHSKPYSDIIGTMGLKGQNPEMIKSLMGSFRDKNIPKGVMFYVQDLFFGKNLDKPDGPIE